MSHLHPAPPTQIPSSLVAKINHDISSPLNAILNGLELLEDAVGQAGDTEEIVKLVKDSALQIRDYIQLTRFAFGPQSNQAQQIVPIESYAEKKKITLAGIANDQATMVATILAMEKVKYQGRIGQEDHAPWRHITGQRTLQRTHNFITAIIENTDNQSVNTEDVIILFCKNQLDLLCPGWDIQESEQEITIRLPILAI